ncbi:hypothetical protein PUNSTDRAFT_82588 [Punctularia strigosozonata HHB-11173 SS5]|uniref:uncharacterized protein n=1 Tax=Punctularia strigosozonata (strain HHB-11173) TaxID=741275 RepID=UPI0004417694|nr:uncharacterized protein PUNSTDRAFT_82588 [Punctularia strigosozonata HHB-11173 SS5]EIN13040.1 hypothetical protein PUNSTDRAFT_82588 [Punctularia strigosozonata HHB-11173 SS5]
MPSPMTMKRIHKEISDLDKERKAGNLGGITLEPCNLASGDLLHWKASIPGPEGSPYEGGTFDVDVHLPPDYPFNAPKVTFTTRIYHMNISERGAVCIDILKSAWSPALSLFKVVLSLSSLMTDPNPRDPLVPSIANEYTRHRPQHDATARQWTQLYAVRADPAAAAPQPESTTPSAANSAPRPRGSRRSSATSAASSSASASAARTRSQRTRATVLLEESTIDLTSDDSEGHTRGGSRGKGRAKREAEVLDLTEDGENAVEGQATEKGKEKETDSRKRQRVDGEATSSGSGASKAREVNGDTQGNGNVIEIND